MLELTIAVPGAANQRVELAGDRSVVIGRSRACGIRIGLPTVSRRHAELVPEGRGRWVLRDLGSTHGIVVRGARVREIGVAGGLEATLGGATIRFDNLASRIGQELDRIIDDDAREGGEVRVEIIGGRSRKRDRPLDQTMA